MALHVVLQVPTLSEDDGPLDEHVRHLKPFGVSSGIVRDVVEAVGASLGKPVRDSLFVRIVFSSKMGLIIDCFVAFGTCV